MSSVVIPGTTLTTLPTAPTARWHPAFSTVTTSSGRVSTATDIQGSSSNLSLPNTSTWNGPKTGTEPGYSGYSRPFWRFESNEYLDVAKGGVGGPLDTVGTRAYSIFFVGRQHRGGGAFPYAGAGSWFQATQVNVSGTLFQVNNSSNSAPQMRAQNIQSAALTGHERVMVGSQLQVFGISNNASGSRFYTNNDVLVGAAPFNGSFTGMEIGRTPGTTAAGAEPSTNTPPNWGPGIMADIYEIVFYKGALTSGQADAIVAALVTGWGITATVNRFLLDGDSIDQGVMLATATSVQQVNPGNCAAMVLSTPGASWAFPAGWQVIGQATSGDKIAAMVTRRDASNSVASQPLSGGRNVVGFQIGANDVSVPTTAAAMYSATVALLHTTTTGYLERGWETRPFINIASSNAVNQGVMDSLRTLMRANQFLIDTSTDAGGSFPGKLGTVELPAITVSGVKKFDLTTDVTGGDAYQRDAGNTLVDGLHPNVTGTLAMMNGGDSLVNAVMTRATAAS